MMYSMFWRRSACFQSAMLKVFKSDVRIRFINSTNADDHNIKKFKRIKRLASTLLFGGTFLTVLWAKKKKQSPCFEDARLVKSSHFNNKNFKLYDYKGFIVPSFVIKNMVNIQNFSCREDDIFVVSFPKTGTTWLQEIIYCITKGIDSSSLKSIEDRFPYLEFVYPGLATIEKMTDQRLIKTHLPYSLLPEEIHIKKPKIFCIVRNPKDVAVSYYHFVRMMTISDYDGSFFNFFDDFISNRVPYGPIWKHYKDMWEHRNDSNVLILSYEDLHKDINGCIKKIADFIGKDITEAEIDAISDHCSFQNMSQNPNVNYEHWSDLGLRNKDEAKFMRKGKIGDWKNYFTFEMNQAMDVWLEENMDDIVIKFSYKDNS